MKKLLLILLLTIPFFGFGQGWEKNYGGTGHDEGRSVQQTTDGGYIICGTRDTIGNPGSYIYLIKTNIYGDLLWSRLINGLFNIGNPEGYDVQQTTDGGYIICGVTQDNHNEMTLIKTDGNGIVEWKEVYRETMGDSEYGYSVEQTTDGGYIICGYRHIDNYSSNLYLVKTDSFGNKQWGKEFMKRNWNYGYSVQQTTDGGYIICGNTKWDPTLTPNLSNYSHDVYLLKTDGNGIEQWSKTFGETGHDFGYDVQQTTDGGYIITGSFFWGSDVWLIKTDGNGDSLWTNTFGGTSSDQGYSVEQTSDGGYIICGENRSFLNGLGVIYLIKTDGNGIEQWSKTYGGNGIQHDYGYDVQQTTDGGYIICGKGSYFNQVYSDVYLIKTDGNGNITSTFNIPTPSSNRKLEKVVDILGRETKPQKNTPFIEIYDDGSTEKKLIIEK